MNTNDEIDQAYAEKVKRMFDKNLIHHGDAIELFLFATRAKLEDDRVIHVRREYGRSSNIGGTTKATGYYCGRNEQGIALVPYSPEIHGLETMKLIGEPGTTFVNWDAVFSFVNRTRQDEEAIQRKLEEISANAPNLAFHR